MLVRNSNPLRTEAFTRFAGQRAHECGASPLLTAL